MAQVQDASEAPFNEQIRPGELEQQYRPIIQSLASHFSTRLKTVVLFGSQARGEAQLNSDHDLFIVVDDLPTEPLARQRAVRITLLPILADLPGPVNFVAKRPDEVAANLTPLLLDVCVDGICLYGEAYFQPYREKALATLRQAGLHRHKLDNTYMWLFPQLPINDWELTWEGYREHTR
jgi:predicted nucleotidyltransferase